MSFALATRAELLKLKRTSSLWLTVIGAGFIPVLLFTGYVLNQEGALGMMKHAIWNVHFFMGWRAISSFLLPMYVILICSLIPQIEFKNNTWKQVFAAPQSITTIFFSKFATIQLLLLLCLVLFNVFMLLVGLTMNLLNAKFDFLHQSLDVKRLLLLNVKIYISALGISAVQYVLSLRFKNFIAPIGIGLAALIVSLFTVQFQWKHVSKIPYAHPALTLKYIAMEKRPFLENHEWNALFCLILFLGLGLADMKLRREKG